MGTRAATSAGRRRGTARTKRGGARANGAAPKRATTAKRRRAAPKRQAKRAAPKRNAKRAAPKRNVKRATLARRLFSRAGLISLRGAIAILALAGALVAGYFFWLRDSSLVAVTEVSVEGVTGSNREEIETTLKREARKMTTLHVRADRLEQAVSSFPTVAGLRTDVGFPHGLRIEVIERPPALVVITGDRQIPVAADGTLLPGVEAPEKLPRLVVDQVPATDRLEGQALDQALVLGAAPPELRNLIEGISYMDAVGVQLEMPGGLELRFGSGARAEAKWTAAAAVLADPKLEAATYVDVRVPERPAVGGAGETTAAVAESPAAPAITTPEDVLSTEG